MGYFESELAHYLEITASVANRGANFEELPWEKLFKNYLCIY